MSKATPCTDRPRPAASLTRSIGFSLRAIVTCGLVASGAFACVDAGPIPVAQPPAPEPDGAPLAFAYETTDGGVLTAASLRGRYTVIAFAATYDLTSQAQLKVLTQIQRDHKPRINVAALVLEPVENKPIVVAFAQGLGFAFPVAIADERTLAGHGPFEGLRAVPSVVILDREGREVLRHVGPLDKKQLEEALVSVERPAP